MKPLIFLCLLAAGCASDAAGLGEEVARSGELGLEWAIFQDGEIVSCIDAEASEVRLELFSLDDDVDLIETLGCYAGIGETRPVDAGDYDVAVQLVSPSGDLIDEVERHDVTVVGGLLNPLGAIEFSLDASQ